MKWYEKLKQARKANELTLQEVEARIGTSNQHLSDIENGKIANPSVFIILRLCNLYEITIEELTDDNQ